MFRLVFASIFVTFVCGIPRLLPQLDGRIVGGRTVEIEDYPYQVSLLYYGGHNCGGSIISNKYVVTAAHCTNGGEEDDLKIRVGSSIKNSGGVIVPVAKIHQHPQFNLWSIDYDISILELASNLTFGPAVNKIDLPGFDESLPEGSNSVVSGWGTLSEGGNSSRHLQAIDVPIVEQERCIRYYGSSSITDRMFCAGLDEGQKDSCQGDSGGPLVADGKLYGIVSWGYGCARPKLPGVYSNILNLRGYIYEVTGL